MVMLGETKVITSSCVSWDAPTLLAFLSSAFPFPFPLPLACSPPFPLPLNRGRRRTCRMTAGVRKSDFVLRCSHAFSSTANCLRPKSVPTSGTWLSIRADACGSVFGGSRRMYLPARWYMRSHRALVDFVSLDSSWTARPLRVCQNADSGGRVCLFRPKSRAASSAVLPSDWASIC